MVNIIKTDDKIYCAEILELWQKSHKIGMDGWQKHAKFTAYLAFIGFKLTR